MQRFTATTVGTLRTGDRFYFPADKDRKTYQITADYVLKKSYNMVNNGKNAWHFDRQAPSNKPVVFLRHTKPLPGEECMLYDLNEGDVFFLQEDVVAEYRVVKTTGSADQKKRFLVEAINSESIWKEWKEDMLVCFVGKSQLQS